MSDKDFSKLMEIAKERREVVKTMTKKEAIASLNRAGILTKKGEFTKHYPALKAYTKGK
jgi:TnpA family transposase